MTFGEAIEQARGGKKIARQGWNGKGMFVFFQDGSVIDPKDGRNSVLRSLPAPVIIRAHLDMKTADGSIQIGWLASQTDMLACDWETVS